MKKKGARDIPDFSQKRKGLPAARPTDSKVRPPAPPRDPIVKPQATSSKSGRRGT
jgi:hypothetical protein